MIIKGGLGDDTFRQGAESAATNASGTQNLSYETRLFGNEGNDKFEKFIGTSTDTIDIRGGEGNDKISGGSGFGTVDIRG